jgi:hypothetical protein
LYPVFTGITREVRRIPEVNETKGYLPPTNTFVLTGTGSCTNLLFYKQSDILKSIATRRVASAAAISEQQVGGPETEPGRDTILKNNKVKGVYRAPG